MLSLDVLSWLGSFACLIFIMRSINQVFLSAGGFWRNPLVMFTAGALFTVAAIVISLAYFIVFLTERYKPKGDGEDEGVPRRAQQRALRNAGAGVHRPWLLRRGRGARGEGDAPHLVTTHPGAVCQGSYTGPVWLVPATLWARSQLLTQWPPPTEGPAAIARKYHATLVGVGGAGGTDGGAALLLVPDRPVGQRGGGGSRQALLDAGGGGGGGEYALLSLEGVEVDLLRDVLGSGSPWSRRCPLQLSHPARTLLLGETTLYMFAESGSAKEQWYSALASAVAPQSLLAATQQLYDDYCRYMASLQVVQPRPLPPAPPPLPPLRPHQPPPKPPQKATPQKKAAVAKEREKQQQQARAAQLPPQPGSARPSGPADPAATPPPAPTPPRPRGRNPFGFILSRFGRGAGRRQDAPAAATAVVTPSGASTAAPSRSASITGLTPGGDGGGGSARQPSQMGLPRPQSEAALQQQKRLPASSSSPHLQLQLQSQKPPEDDLCTTPPSSGDLPGGGGERGAADAARPPSALPVNRSVSDIFTVSRPFSLSARDASPSVAEAAAAAAAATAAADASCAPASGGSAAATAGGEALAEGTDDGAAPGSLAASVAGASTVPQVPVLAAVTAGRCSRRWWTRGRGPAGTCAATATGDDNRGDGGGGGG